MLRYEKPLGNCLRATTSPIGDQWRLSDIPAPRRDLLYSHHPNDIGLHTKSPHQKATLSVRHRLLRALRPPTQSDPHRLSPTMTTILPMPLGLNPIAASSYSLTPAPAAHAEPRRCNSRNSRVPCRQNASACTRQQYSTHADKEPCERTKGRNCSKTALWRAATACV